MNELRELQKYQNIHDLECHKDILRLKFDDSFKHDVLHFGKYSGRLSKLLELKYDISKSTPNIKKTIVDAFIIILHLSNTFNFDLLKILNCMDIDNGTIDNIVTKIIKNNPDLYKSLNVTNYDDRLLQFILKLTATIGPLQKSAEDLDHLLGLDIKKMRDELTKLTLIILLEGKIWGVNFNNDVKQRWAVIKQKQTV